MTKNLTEEVKVYNSDVLSIHIMVCGEKELFNRGFCHIKTVSDEITLWADEPFKKTGNLLKREWTGLFTTEIINGEVRSVRRKFSMKSLSGIDEMTWMSAMFTQQPTDEFLIEGLFSMKVALDLPPEEIEIQIPLSVQAQDLKQDTEEPEDVVEAIEEELGRANGFICNTEYYQELGGAFEEGLPRYHQYRVVLESELFQFIKNAIDREKEVSNEILSKVSCLADLTQISHDLNVIVDKAIMAKREGNLNQAFKYYDQFFQHNQTWFMLYYGLAKLLCLFREYRMAFACIKICTYLYPEMTGGAHYTSEHNLLHHYEHIYALAFQGAESESYLRSLGRPLNTVRILNSSGKPNSNAPVFRIQTIQPKGFDVSSAQPSTASKRSKRKNRKCKDRK